MKKFWAVLVARNKEFFRDRSALGWNILFPLLVIFGFAFAFTGSSQDVFKVAIHVSPGAASAAAEQTHEFLHTKYVQFIPVTRVDDELPKLRRQQLDMVLELSPGHDRYWVNSTSPKGYLLEKIMQGDALAHYAKQTVDGHEIRYVDWLIAGLLGMNMMFSALFGVGYTIVRYRKNGVLKRLKATPLTSFEFLLAQVASRFLVILAVTIVVFFGSLWVVHFRMVGSYLALFFVLSLGAICLISLALLVAARTASEEFAGGLLNLISWPMMFLSGVWFSLEGMHPAIQKAAQVFPLTHVIEAARKIMTEGTPLSQLGYPIAMLIGMTALFLIVGSALFRWE